MKLEFESIEEVKEFVTKLKGTRGGKAEKEEGETAQEAPKPLAPPAATFSPNATQAAANTFAPPAAGATAAAAGPFAAVATGPAPEVQALVTRINTRIEGQEAAGTDPVQMLTWFRGQVGAGAEAATMDQIKAIFLPKLSVAQLEGIAKMVAA